MNIHEVLGKPKRETEIERRRLPGLMAISISPPSETARTNNYGHRVNTSPSFWLQSYDVKSHLSESAAAELDAVMKKIQDGEISGDPILPIVEVNANRQQLIKAYKAAYPETVQTNTPDETTLTNSDDVPF